ncbi:MAG: YcjF family protein [Rhizobiaceae bacterium]
MNEKSRKPRAVSVSPTPATKVKTAQKQNMSTNRKPRSISDLSVLELVPDELANEPVQTGLAPPVPKPRKSFSFLVLLLIAASGLISLFAGIAIDNLIRELFSRNDWLGWLGLGLASLLGFAVIAIILREIWCIARLSKISNLRKLANDASEKNDNAKATKVVRELVSMYSKRPDTAHGRSQLSAHTGEVIDGADLIKLAERDLLSPLDSVARTMVMDSAKKVSIVIAVSPRALVDVGFVLVENLRLIRRLSQLYGGRPGTIGFWRLAGNVVSHLAATGIIASGDSLIQQFIGHGIAAKVSAKLGEGVVNGLLTARIGIAAMDVCRPVPFIYEKRPAIAGFLGELTKFGNSSASVEEETGNEANNSKNRSKSMPEND